jgi:hypothetical protein
MHALLLTIADLPNTGKQGVFRDEGPASPAGTYFCLSMTQTMASNHGHSSVIGICGDLSPTGPETRPFFPPGVGIQPHGQRPLWASISADDHPGDGHRFIRRFDRPKTIDAQRVACPTSSNESLKEPVNGESFEGYCRSAELLPTWTPVIGFQSLVSGTQLCTRRASNSHKRCVPAS